MAVVNYPSNDLGVPSASTDDHKPVITMGMRFYAESASKLISGLRWYVAADGVGATARAYAVRKSDSVVLASSSPAVTTLGVNTLIFTAPMTLTSADEVYFAIEQDRGTYTYIANATIDGSQEGIAAHPGWGVWAYGNVTDAVATWNASAGNNTGNWYGVDLIIGAITSISVIATHSPPTAAVGATVTLDSMVSGETGAVGYAWTQVSGPAVALATPSAPSTTFVAPSAGTYVFRVTVTDAGGSASDDDTVSITALADTTPPTVPTGLGASGVTQSGAQISWSPSTDANGVAGYRVYIGGVLYGTSTTPEKAIVGRSPGSHLLVTVSAGDAAGNWSAESAPFEVVTLPADVPPPAGGAGVLWLKMDSGAWMPTGGPASSVQDPEWVFRPETYGAKGDGVFLGGTVRTTAGSPAIVCDDAVWSAADIGKAIMVESFNAAGNGAEKPIIGTIAAVADATHATMSAPAVRTEVVSAFYATDDTAAFLACSLAVREYLKTADNPHAVIELRRRFYGLATKPTADVDGAIGTWARAQLPLPVNPDQFGRKWVIEVRGEGGIDGATFTSWHQTVPQLSGACLVSMLNITTADYIPNYPVAVVGGTPYWSGEWTLPSNSFNNTLVRLDGFRVLCPYSPGQIAFDLVREGQYDIGTISADIFSAPGGLTGGFMKSSNQDGMGFRTNYTGYNDRCTIDALYIQGYWTGAMIDEHCQWDNVTVIYSHFGLYVSIPTGGTVQHGAVIDYASVEVSDYPLYCAVGSASDVNPVAYFGLVIQMLDNEDSVTQHIYDPGSCLQGTVNLFPSGSSSTVQDAKVVGAHHLTVNNLAGGSVIRT